MPVLIGGDQAYLQRVIGDFVVSYQWVNDEPAMIIWPKIKRTLTNGAFVLALSSAYKYDDPQYLIVQSIEAVKYLGFEPLKSTVHKMADIIIEGLPDLVMMPPAKPMEKPKNQEIAGEMIIKVDGRTIMHDEVTMPEYGVTV